MIVKNESRIIERLLNSTKGIIDCLSICDTGSTDNTVEIIKAYMKAHNIPGKVYQHEWKNFGYNRSLSAAMALETIKELGFSPDSTYFLLLDADMILQVSPKFDKGALTVDAYTLLQKNNLLSYWNIRLIRASLPWECLGPTHEYWTCKSKAEYDRLELLSIDDREDGGCKSDKIKRDIALLTQALKDEPDNLRYQFYLANSYKDDKNYPLALEYYEKRISVGGWDEEIFESLLQIALTQEILGFEPEKIIDSYKRAFKNRPFRLEPLFQLACFYRCHHQYNLAYEIAKLGEHFPYPHFDSLFIRRFIYEWGIKLELCFAAFHTNRFEECQKLSKELLENPDVPNNCKHFLLDNLCALHLQCMENIELAEINP